MPAFDSFSERVRDQAFRIGESGPAALSGLFDLTSQRLLRYAVAVTRNQHDAEDVIQAVLVQVAGEPKLLAKADNPWHYLLRMVRNRSLLVLRERKKRTTVNHLLDLITRLSVDEIDIEETHRAVWKALRRLPANQSEIVVLKIWEEMSFAQIGSLLDLSPSTAASRYRYAMEKLERHFRVSDREVWHG